MLLPSGGSASQIPHSIAISPTHVLVNAKICSDFSKYSSLTSSVFIVTKCTAMQFNNTSSLIIFSHIFFFHLSIQFFNVIKTFFL